MTLRFALLVSTKGALTSNGRDHFQVRARKTREIREGVRHECAHDEPIRHPVDIDVTFHWADNRRRDAPNWWPTLKAAIDELVSLGILADDSNRHVLSTTMRPGAAKPELKGYMLMEVTLKERPETSREGA